MANDNFRSEDFASPEEPSLRAARLAQGLFPHQVEGVAFLLSRRRAILADDMGLGKTRQAIIALQEAAGYGPYLVVCPASVKQNWQREIRAALPLAQVRILGTTGGESNTASSNTLPCDEWVIVNYDILAQHCATLLALPWAGLIFDEAHYLKNHASKRSRLARDLVARVSAERGAPPAVYLLTGTPLTNRPRDLFALLQMIGHPLAKSFLSFAKRYCGASHNGFGWITDGASRLDELATQMQGVMLRRTKSEVLALPPKLRSWMPVEVPEGTGATEIRRAMQILIQRKTGRLTTAGQESGPDAQRQRLLASLTTARRKVAVAKIPTTIDLVESAIEQGEKVLVFSCFDEPVQRIARHFGASALTLTGATPTAQRQDLADRFQQDESARVLVANIQAGGVGLNLTAARQVIFNDLDWVPANHWQAEDRAYRIGQTESVTVTYLVAGETVDEFVASVLQLKSDLVEAVVEGTGSDGALSGGVLEELERLLGQISPRLTDTSEEASEDEFDCLMRQAIREYKDTAASEHGSSLTPPLDASARELQRKALERLAAALQGPQTQRYQAVSRSRPDQAYQLEVGPGGDIICSCPGFEYRGACRHVRDLKSALVSGGGLPAGIVSVA